MKIINVRTTYKPATTSSITTPKLFLNFLSKKLTGKGFLISKYLNKIKIYKYNKNISFELFDDTCEIS